MKQHNCPENILLTKLILYIHMCIYNIYLYKYLNFHTNNTKEIAKYWGQPVGTDVPRASQGGFILKCVLVKIPMLLAWLIWSIATNT